MFNINRPVVIYKSMTLSFHHLDFRQAYVEMLEPKMEVNGKRASAFLHFQIKTGGDIVGTGFKKLAISVRNGYETEPMQAFVDEYVLPSAFGYPDYPPALHRPEEPMRESFALWRKIHVSCPPPQRKIGGICFEMVRLGDFIVRQIGLMVG